MASSLRLLGAVLLFIVSLLADARCPPKRVGTYTSVEQALEECAQLDTLHLKGSNLTVITPSTFQDFKYLSHLYISEANLTKIEPDSFKDLHYLTTLSITRSGLKEVDLGDLSGVEILDLYENPGLNISGEAKDLQILNVNDCELKELPYELIKDSKDIILSARYNNIDHIAKESLSKTKLTDLSFNKISKLPEINNVPSLVKLTGNPLYCSCPEIKVFLSGQYRGRVYCSGPAEFENLLVNKALEHCHRAKRDVVLSRSTRGDIDSLMEEDYVEGSGEPFMPSTTTIPPEDDDSEGSGIFPVFTQRLSHVPLIDEAHEVDNSTEDSEKDPIIVNVKTESEEEEEEERDYLDFITELNKEKNKSIITTTTTTTTEDPLFKKYHKDDIDKIDLISEIPDISTSEDTNETNEFNIPFYKDLVNETNSSEDTTDEPTSPTTVLLNRIQEQPRQLSPTRGDIPGISEPGISNGKVAEEPAKTSVGTIVLFSTLAIIAIILLAMACRRNRESNSEPAPVSNPKERKTLLDQPEKPPKNTNDYVIIPLKDDDDGHIKENGNGAVLVHSPANGNPPTTTENGLLAPPPTTTNEEPVKNGSPRVSDSDDEVVRVLVTERFYPDSLPRTPERIHKPRQSPSL